MASISQMSKFYHLISVEVAISKGKITNEFKSNCKIFIPFSNNARYDETVAGTFVSASELYWHDPTGCVDWTKEIILHDTSIEDAVLTCKALAAIYPDLRDFFLDECGVPEMPPFGSYLHILLQLSSVALPSQAAPIVFQVFLKLADDLNGGIVKYEEISYLKESFSKLENKVLPTVQDKWVSLHPSFGLICFPDDEELRHQFEHLEDIDFLHFGDLNNEQKELLSGKIIMLLKTIGVPSLSEVVSREAISYGSGDNKEKVCLVNWVLPYAQRYLFKFHPKTYFHLKEFGLEKINQLQVAVVDKLFYRNNLKGHNSVSKKRFECSCLLQGSVLYMTSTSDSHPIFLELSRLFFYGAPELHLANFLLMIMNMAESGSTVEQIEYFVLTSQKVPQLPDEEPVWSPLSSCSIFEDKTSHQFDLPITIIRRKSSTYSRKQGSNSSWPPPDWKGKLDLNAPQGGCFKTLSGEVPSVSEMKEISSPGGPSHTQDVSVSPELGERTVQDDLDTSVNLAVQDAEISKGHSSLVQSSSLHDSQRNACFETELVTIDSVGTKMSSINAEFDYGKDRLGLRTLIDGQSHATGRWGEAMAYKYFSAKLNSSPVKWVNELKETGLPYDLIIGEDGDNVQHIEVKTTTSTNKDWFPITAREWQFATDKGDLFSIAHVVLLDTNNAKITVFKNPLKLCQQKVLHLAILMSEQDNNSHS
uniref:Putative tRNA threonylcarbamoyladenosine biosynthesis protein Gcp n=2 Tax=Anthurium amnicola TaxID=1678845 RepID=A0A1D1YMP8_9ARAE